MNKLHRGGSFNSRGNYLLVNVFRDNRANYFESNDFQWSRLGIRLKVWKRK